MVYFAIPGGSWITAFGGSAVIEVEYYSHGTPGDTFMIEYDSGFSDDVEGYYHDSAIAEKPAEQGWYTATIECPNPAFLGRQNSKADFRVTSLGNGDEYIGDVVIK